MANTNPLTGTVTYGSTAFMAQCAAIRASAATVQATYLATVALGNLGRAFSQVGAYAANAPRNARIAAAAVAAGITGPLPYAPTVQGKCVTPALYQCSRG